MPFKKFLLLFVSITIAVTWSFIALRPQHSSEPALDIWMLNVGQGESVLLREPTGKKLLFDGGPNDSVLSQLGSVLSPWDKTLDLVVVSHNHSDHLRGLIAVLERYEVKELWISGAIHTTEDYEAFLRTVQNKQIRPKIVYFNTQECELESECPLPTSFGQAKLQVYHPLTNKTGDRPKDQHDATVIVKASYGAQSILLTGDIDEGHEKELLQVCPPIKCSLQATILQIPHHGSASGLLPTFLMSVNPEVAFIPVGLANKFKHPTADILKKLEEAKVPVYRTDTQGRIRASLYQDRMEIKLEGK